MAFKEKSAWLMSLALALAGVGYYRLVAGASAELGELAPPMLPHVVIYTALLVAVAIAGHIAIAVFAPSDAGAPTDERERRIFDRAAHLAGYALAGGTVLCLGLYLVFNNAHMLFYGVFASLMLSQLLEYLLQILFYRSHA